MPRYLVDRDKCPVCFSTDGTVLFSCLFEEDPIRDYLARYYKAIDFSYLEHGRYTLVRCKGCDVVYQKEIPGPALMFKIYEEWINPTSALKNRGKRRMSYYLELVKQIADMIEFLGGGPAERKVLDFGMGWGEWCRLALGFGCETYGMELSPARIDHARKWGVGVLGWEEIPEHRFDIMNAEQVFEHIPNPHEVLVHLASGLKPGGIIRIGVPDGWDVDRRLRKGDWRAPKETRNSLKVVTPLEHIQCYTHASLAFLGVRAGLVEVNVSNAVLLSWKQVAKTVAKPVYYTLRGSKGPVIWLQKPREG